jgi:hypothetical protein
MPRAIPILIIVGLAIYSFFDVLQTDEDRIRRYPRMFWLIMVLIPVLGAALWWTVGRPKRGRGGYGPPRVIHLRGGASRPAAPDDDPNFIKRLDEEAWRRKRDEQRAQKQEGSAAPDPQPPATAETPPKPTQDKRPNDGPLPGPGIAPAG